MKRRGILGLMAALPFASKAQANKSATETLVRNDTLRAAAEHGISSAYDALNPVQQNKWSSVDNFVKKQLRRAMGLENAIINSQIDVAYHLNGMPTHLYTMNSTSITWRMIRARQWYRKMELEKKKNNQTLAERIVGWYDDDIYYGD
jgi:hypothetical protein